MAQVSEHEAEVDGLAIHWRSAPGPAPQVLYLHGVPNSSQMWVPFLERTGGIAPDLPGFGASAKPADFDYSIAGYDGLLEHFCEQRGADRLSLVVHDWGALGLALAQRRPELIERLVVIDAVPLLPGYRWHRIARAWRTPLLGELVMGLTSPRTLRLISREANATPGPLPQEFLDEVMGSFDHGTQRAILRLYRSAPEEALAAAGRDLSAIGAPALVVWGGQDPYIAPAFADAYGQALADAEVLHVPDAGHWPWLDSPDLLERIAGFLR